MSQYIGGQSGIALPLPTTFGGADGESVAGKTIAATAGLPGFQLGCAAGPAISAYGATAKGEQSGGGGTAANARFSTNQGENLTGDGA